MKRFVWVLLTLVLTMSGAGAQFVPITPEAVAAVDVVRAYGTGIPTGGGFSPDGLRLALIGTFGVQVYTFSAPDLPETFGGERFPASAFAFSPDGVQLVVGGQDYGLRAYDLSGQRPPLTEYPSAVGAPTDAAYHPSGAPLAISTYTAPGEILLLDPLDLSVQATWSPPLAIITQLAYSPDGARVVVGDRDGAAALLDSQTGEALMTWPDGQGSAVTDLRFDADGAAVWIGHADGQARRYTLPDGTFGGAVPLAEAFTPTFPDLSLDITPSTVTITDTSAAFSFSLPFMDGVRAVAVTDDGLGIAIGGGGTVGGLFSRDGTLYANVFTESAPIRTMAYT
ncbi:MAG: hypothetical protein MUC99_12265, partial [Anaerolineae bacterium]|nr:hypothetical protein [Anaerolineae bacterium]